MSRQPQVLRFCTIGHSTRPTSAFVDLLRSVGADLVVDIRAFPRSRRNPAYDHDVLPGCLAPLGIGYEHLPQLGGRRHESAAVDPATNGFWENKAFHNYADHALGEDFHAGLDRLLDLGRRHIPALMCAEAVWWRCHRRIVADHLLHQGAEVYHVLAPGRMDQARLTPAARIRGMAGWSTRRRNGANDRARVAAGELARGSNAAPPESRDEPSLR